LGGQIILLLATLRSWFWGTGDSMQVCRKRVVGWMMIAAAVCRRVEKTKLKTKA